MKIKVLRKPRGGGKPADDPPSVQAPGDRLSKNSEAAYHILTESANDAIFRVYDYRFVDCNSKTLEIFGCSRRDQIVGFPPYEFSPELQPDGRPSREKSQEVIRAALDGKPQFFEWRHKRLDGTLIDTEVSLKRLVMGEEEYVLAVVRNVTERKRAEDELKRLNEKLMREHHQRKLLSNRLIQLLETGYREVSMELHDHVGQALITLKIDLDMISRLIDKNNEVLSERIELAKRKAVEVVEDIEKIAHGLRPSMIDNLGLVPSLRALFKEIKQHKEIEIHFFHRCIPKRFDQEKELTVYRVVQEALTNIIKHSEAKHCFVNLVKKDDAISLSVEDDGVGFDARKKGWGSREKVPLGLLIMRERVVQVKGEFSIESRIGGGVHLLIEIPV
jgi:PAS domain S-box-containing protein